MDKKGTHLPAEGHSISFFPVPIITISAGMEYTDKLPVKVSELFQFILNEYPMFYDNLSEIKIKPNLWEFYSDNNTIVYANTTYLMEQLIILQDFETTIYPIKYLKDYSYIDLRINNQIIVKEKYRKG